MRRTLLAFAALLALLLPAAAGAQPLQLAERATAAEATACQPTPPDGGGPGYGYVPAPGTRVCWSWAGANGGGPINLSARPWGVSGNASAGPFGPAYASPLYPERIPIRYAGKPLGGHFCGDDLERIQWTLRALCEACEQGQFGHADCRLGPTWEEVADWAATHPRTGTGGGGSAPGCPVGWQQCPPPREADRYSSTWHTCWRAIGGGQLTAAEVPACHVAPPPPVEPPPEPPAPEPPLPEPPGERSVCESALHVVVELGCGVLAPLPECSGGWVFECRAVAP